MIWLKIGRSLLNLSYHLYLCLCCNGRISEDKMLENLLILVVQAGAWSTML